MDPLPLPPHPPLMPTLLDQARDAAHPDVVRTVSGLIGVSPATTNAAFAMAIPTLLAGVLATASTPAGAHWVRSIISEGGFGATTLDRLPVTLAGGRPTERVIVSGRHLLASFFGSKQEDVADTVARSANVPCPAARKLMCIAAPMVMGVLGREVAAHQLDWAGMMNYLASQRASIAHDTPPALMSMVGLSAGEADDDGGEGLDVSASEPGRLGAWVLPLVAALVGVSLVFVMHPPWGDGTKPVPSALPRQLQALTLPTGERLDVRMGSFLAKLHAYLASTIDVSVPRRFLFDDVAFEQGSVDLTARSRHAVDALGRMMNAYPATRVTLEGFTDSLGDPVANKDLSFDRTHAIKERLVERGVAPERIRTEGFGSERPVASNDTEEGRAQNRRTEVVVMSR